MFSKSYLRLILLGVREIYVCWKCNNVLLNQEETMKMKRSSITVFSVTDVVYGTIFVVNM